MNFYLESRLSSAEIDFNMREMPSRIYLFNGKSAAAMAKVTNIRINTEKK